MPCSTSWRSLRLLVIDVGQVQARKFVLARHRFLEEAAFGAAFDDPVVERAVILELQRADRMRDVLDRVRQRVREIVHRVDAPGVAGAVVVRVADAVDRRVAQVHVGRGHVDLGAHDVHAVGEFAGLHAAEQVQRFGRRTVAERRVDAGLGKVAAVGGHVGGGSGCRHTRGRC